MVQRIIIQLLTLCTALICISTAVPAQAADGSGRVFNPNPVVSLKDTNLKDENDADVVPEAAYVDVILRDLDGTGYLEGPYVSTRLTDERAYEPTLQFHYTREDDRFEEVMVYYHIDAVARYLKGLGFDFVDNGPPIPVNVHSDHSDAPFYDYFTRKIHLGDGGVDDAEDAEVIVHEYGHVIQYRQVGGWFGTGEGEAMSEGFCDFLAASYFSAVSDGFPDTTVCDWEWVHSTTGGRAVNSDKYYPEDTGGSTHEDGMIWSAALWELFEALGRDASIRLVIKSHDRLSVDAGFLDGAKALLAADRDLNNGANVKLIRGIMERRGILSPPELAPDTFENNDTAETATEIQLPFIEKNLSITPDDNDYYQFYLGTRKKVSLAIEFNPIYGQLHRALMTYEGKTIGTKDPLQAGHYLLKVSGIDGATNDYGLKILADMHGDEPRTATLVRMGDDIESFIDFTEDVDVFQFEARQGDVVGLIVEVEQLGSRLDASLRLLDSSGKKLIDRDDSGIDLDGSGFGYDEKIDRFPIPADGLYWVEIRGFPWPSQIDDRDGTDYAYTLMLFEGGLPADDHDTLKGSPTRLVADQPVEGVISFRGDVDAFQFTAMAGQLVDLDVEMGFNRSLLNVYAKRRLTNRFRCWTCFPRTRCCCKIIRIRSIRRRGYRINCPAMQR